MSAVGTGSLPVTIQAIAEEIGVSVPTVSKVLNGRADVAAETRSRVEEALARHQYRRRSKPAGHTSAPLLELAFHDLGSPWSMEIVSGVERAAEQRGLGVVLSELHGRHRPQADWVDLVLNRRSRGVILVMSALTQGQQAQLASRGIPFVILDTDGDTPEDVPTVGSNNWFGGLSATRHLVQLGHRRIAMVTGPADVLCSRARLDGWRTAQQEGSVPVADDLVRYGDFTQESGYRHGRALFALAEPPTAVFAGSDMQALGVLRAAREAGLDVPGDLSVVGYDDLPLAQWVAPTLTTVHQPLHEMAATATRIVLDEDHDPTARPPRVELATHLVVRESTAPPRG